MSAHPEWTTREVAVLRREYPLGTPVTEIAAMLGRSQQAVHVKAQRLGVRHPLQDASVAVSRFEQERGAPLIEIAMQYRNMRLARRELAADIGLYCETLKRFIPPEIWHSWPHYTAGRRLANEQRRA
ncbi:hypothetical protein ACT3UJ_02165 [Halomonas sp. 86]|uniref:hypothetical protein n=1 Tax=unclassified Halomonas TaxID=2609666 RepID=UPI004033E3E8